MVKICSACVSYRVCACVYASWYTICIKSAFTSLKCLFLCVFPHKCVYVLYVGASKCMWVLLHGLMCMYECVWRWRYTCMLTQYICKTASMWVYTCALRVRVCLRYGKCVCVCMCDIHHHLWWLCLESWPCGCGSIWYVSPLTHPALGSINTFTVPGYRAAVDEHS